MRNKTINLETRSTTDTGKFVGLNLVDLIPTHTIDVFDAYSLQIKVTGTISTGGIPIKTSQFNDLENLTTKETITEAGVYDIDLTSDDNVVLIGGDETLTGTGLRLTNLVKKKIANALSQDLYQGVWDASTDTPTLPTPSVDNQGYWYRCTVAGTYNGDVYAVGDMVVSNGLVWEYVPAPNYELGDYVKKDGSTPFTSTQKGVDGVDADDFATVEQTSDNNFSDERLFEYDNKLDKVLSKNLFNKNDEDIKLGYFLNTIGAEIANVAYFITGYIKLDAGQTVTSNTSVGGGNSAFYDKDYNLIGSSSISNVTVTNSNATPVYVRYSINSTVVDNVQIEDGSSVTSFVNYNNFVAIDNSIDFDKVSFKASDNLINEDELLLDMYVLSTGAYLPNASYNSTPYIDIDYISDDDIIYFGNNGELQTYRFVLFLDENGDSISEYHENITSITKPTNAKFLVASYSVSYTLPQINNTTLKEYSVYKTYIRNEFLPDTTSDDLLDSITGKEANILEGDTLASGSRVELLDFPMHTKKGLKMSFYGDLTSIVGSISFGKGYNQYRGDWLKIDASSIEWTSGDTGIVVETTTHGLTISTFIKCSISLIDGVCSVVLQSLGGMFQVDYDWGFEANYEPFLLTTSQDLNNYKLTAGNSDFQYPVWAFGDSYFGVDETRWPGTIRDLGFFNFYIHGLAGQGAEGAYADFVKSLNYGTPKYLIWCLGMNGSDYQYETYLNYVIGLCEAKNIELILATIPTVPDRDKEYIKTYVENSGYRYIDFYKAVGADSVGNWYTGYQDADEVHPTSLGSQALATQVLVDFPEIMQY